MGPLGAGFVEDAKKANRLVYAWTVNEANLIRWCVRHELDAVMTDKPVLFGKVAAEWKGPDKGFVKEDGDGNGDEKLEKLSLGQVLQVWLMTFLVLTIGRLIRLRYFPSVDSVRFEKSS